MQTLFDHLDFVTNHVQKTNDHLNQKQLNSIQFFSANLLERLSKASKGLKVLLSCINSDNDLEFSCGIILRSALLDILIVQNLYKILIENEGSSKNENEKEEVVKKFCDTILADGLENTVKYMKAAKEVNIIKQDQLTEMYKNFVRANQEFFQPYAGDGSVPICKYTFISPDKLFKRLANTPQLKELSKIYDSYLFFSKYDHFGILYYETSRCAYTNKINRIRRAIELFIGTLAILHLGLRLYSDNDSFLNDQSNIAAKYLCEKILNLKTEEGAGNVGGTIC